jgi:hypothetical protein
VRVTSTVLVTLLGFACAGTAGQHAEQIKAGLSGLEGRRIMSCIGAPQRIDRLDATIGHELWRYQFPLEVDRVDWGPGFGPLPGEEEEEEDRAAWPRGTIHPIETPEPLETPGQRLRQEPDGPGLCSFVFELQGGVVREVRVSGETSEGLTAEFDCTRLLRRCLPEPILEE